MMKMILYCLLLLILQGCACSFAYKYDYGRKNKARYLDVVESQFTIGINVEKNLGFTIHNLTKYNAPKWIKDSISTVRFNAWKFSFPDGTVLEQKSRPMGISAKCYDKEKKEIPCLEYYYTCNDFNEKVKRFKHLNLKVNYDLDSLGVVTHHEKKYVLVRKKYFRVAVH